MAKKQAAGVAKKPAAKKETAVDRDAALELLKGGMSSLVAWRKLFAGNKATVDLSQADLRGAKLAEYPLQSASLTGADLSKANLKEATLGRLEGANLEGAKLAGATIRGLTKCSLLKADLSHAKLVGEKGTASSLAGSNATGAKFNGAASSDLVADGLIAEDATFDEAIVERGSFQQANFRGARLTGAEFYECDFTGADFTGADLSNAILARCKLTGSNLTQAKLVDANLVQSELTNAVVAGADFTRAALGGVMLRGVDTASVPTFDQAITEKVRPSAKLLETHLDKLVQATAKLTSASSSVYVNLPSGGRVELSWKTTARRAQSQWSWYRERLTRKPKTRPGLGGSLKEQLRFLADLCLAGHVAGETLEAKKSGDMQAPAFERLALRGWLDAFGVDVESPAALERFDVFVNALAPHVDPGKLGRAIKMLQAERFQLFNEVDDEHVAGVVKSQSQEETLYACRLTADGKFACCDQHLSPCMGMGVGGTHELCKHVLVLVLGLTKVEQLSRSRVVSWVEASAKRAKAKGSVDEDLMSEILIRYKSFELGELDWRPTETTPEDYYSF